MGQEIPDLKLPFSNIAGLPIEAQRQIRRNFEEVAQNLSTGGPRPYIFIAASNATDWEKSVADVVCDGVTDSTLIADAIVNGDAIVAGGGGITVYLSSGDFILDGTLAVGRCAAIIGMTQNGSGGGTTLEFNTGTYTAGIGGAHLIDVTQLDGSGLSKSIYMRGFTIFDNGSTGTMAAFGGGNNSQLVIFEHGRIGGCKWVVQESSINGNLARLSMTDVRIDTLPSGGAFASLSLLSGVSNAVLVNVQSTAAFANTTTFSSSVIVNPVRLNYVSGSGNFILDATTVMSSGTAAGGDLSGTYPNPSVVDDSHAHTASTLPSTIVYDGDAAGGDLTGTYPSPTLAAIITAATKGTASKVPTITYDAKGRITAVTETTISGSGIDITAVHSGDAAGGDLSGTYPNPSVTDDSHAHTASTLSGVVKTGDAAGGDLDGTYPDPTVAQLQGNAVDSGAPSDADVLTWVAADSKWEPQAAAGGAPTGAAGGDLSGTYPDPDVVDDSHNHTEATIDATNFAPTGLTGATSASRYVGATASGSPVSGTFAVGDFVIDQGGQLWICTTAGSPGTWAQITNLAAISFAMSITYAALAGATFSGNVTLPSVAVSGIGTATAASRYVGARNGAAPSTGTWLTGDWYIDKTNSAIGICTAGGTPGTWVILQAKPFGTAGGDLSGTYPNPAVAKLQGSAVDTTAPSASGQLLIWDNSAAKWVPKAVSSDMTLAASGNATVTGIQGASVDSTPPTGSQVLTYNGSTWIPADPNMKLMGMNSTTTAQTGITANTNLTGTDVTFTAKAGHAYLLTGSCLCTKTTAGDAQVAFANGTTQIQLLGRNTMANGANQGFAGVWVDTPGAGSVTYRLRATGNLTAGSVDIAASSLRPTWLAVFDLGPMP